MFKVNLHDYRYELKKIEIQKRVMKALAIIFGSLALTGIVLLSEQMKADSLGEEIKQLENQIQTLSGDFEAIEKIKGKQKRVEEIIGGITDLRNHQMQAAQILADLNLNVPDEIWLTHVTQKTLEQVINRGVPIIFVGDPEKLSAELRKRKRGEKAPYEFIEIIGKVFGTYGDSAVTEYVRYLETIPYFEKVFLSQTSYDLLGTFPVRIFNVYCYMPAKKKEETT